MLSLYFCVSSAEFCCSVTKRGAGTAMAVRRPSSCELTHRVQAGEGGFGRNGAGKKGKRKGTTKQMPVTYKKSGVMN
jgi:hypothetical protein